MGHLLGFGFFLTMIGLRSCFAGSNWTLANKAAHKEGADGESAPLEWAFLASEINSSKSNLVFTIPSEA
jgi:hypothetical protein